MGTVLKYSNGVVDQPQQRICNFDNFLRDGQLKGHQLNITKGLKIRLGSEFT